MSKAMFIKDYDSCCGECPLIDWCGEPYELPYLCQDKRFENMTADEYISIAETVNIDEEIEGTSTYKETVANKVHEIAKCITCKWFKYNDSLVEDVEEERDYWKREAIKNTAELGEIKIRQAELGLTHETIQEYKKFEDECVAKGFSFNSLLEARERQTPIHPIGKKMEDADIYSCPNCNKGLTSTVIKFCFCCGQAIKWED